MISRQANLQRTGSVVPLFALTIVILMIFISLAIDLGMMALARNQCQDAADAAALWGARQLNGTDQSVTDSHGNTVTYNPNNFLSVNNAAQTAADNNYVLAQAIVAGNVAVQVGSYDYSSASSGFTVNNLTTAYTADQITSGSSIPKNTSTSPATDINWTACRATVGSGARNYIFGWAFSMIGGGNYTNFNVSAVATAVHRPRDIGLVVDFSGSMGLMSQWSAQYNAGNSIANRVPGGNGGANASAADDFPAYGGSGQYSQINDATNMYPAFGGYSVAGPSASPLYMQNTSWTYDNVTHSTNSGNYPMIISDFQCQTLGAETGDTGAIAVVPAFWSAGTASAGAGGNNGGVISGDVPPYQSGTTFAQTMSQITATTAPYTYAPAVSGTNTYASGSNMFWGFTQGPGYWGATFYMWPPSVKQNYSANSTPTTTDWRQRFFYVPSSGTNTVSDNPGPNGSASPSRVTNSALLYSTASFTWNDSTGASETLPVGSWLGPNGQIPTSGTVGSTKYVIDYDAIMVWLNNVDSMLSHTTTGSKILPDLLRVGRVTYYDAKPTSINAYARADSPTKCFQYTPSAGFTNWEALAQSDRDMLNRRFWMEYIDYVLMVRQTAAGVYRATNQDVVQAQNSYTVPSDSISYQLLHGDDFAWGTTSMPSTGTGSGSITTQTGFAGQNPLRPKLHFWFGPWSMYDFVTNIRWVPYWPGNIHIAPLYQCMLGFNAALTDVQNNHPNDYVTMAYFSNPTAKNMTYTYNGSTYYMSTTYPSNTGQAAALQTALQNLNSTYSVDPGSAPGRFNRIRAPLGRYYKRLTGSLWYPPGAMDFTGITAANADTTSNWQSVSGYDKSNTYETPHAQGHTCYGSALMTIYNQFSALTSLQTYSSSNGLTCLPGEAGGNGRVGAQKLIIFETDGECTTYVDDPSSVYNSGSNQTGYYSIRPAATTNANGTVNTANELFPNVYAPGYSGGYSTLDSNLNGSGGIVSQLVSDYSLPSKPVLIHCLVFKTPSISFNDYRIVGHMMQLGSTLSTSVSDTTLQNGTTGSTGYPADHIIDSTGSNTAASVQTALQNVFQSILQNGIQLTLVE